MVNIAGTEVRSYADINMTPLIDVMLVLLIIFIITIPTQTHAVKIDNPTGTPPAGLTPPVIDLSIDFDGTVAWNRTPVDHATLLGYMQAAAHEAVPPEVHVRVDRSSRYEIVAQTLAELQQRGLRKIGFVNEGFL